LLSLFTEIHRAIRPRRQRCPGRAAVWACPLARNGGRSGGV